MCERGDPMGRKFQAGDTVKHVPTGETWVLACDQEGTEVIVAGWPETLASAADCMLKEAATPEKREKMLRGVSSVTGGSGHSYRRSLAHRQLVKMVLDRVLEKAGPDHILHTGKATAKRQTTLNCECGGDYIATQTDKVRGMHVHQCNNCMDVVLVRGQRFPESKEWPVDLTILGYGNGSK